MSLIYEYDGGVITHNVAPSDIALTHRADMGEASFGGIPIEDPAASLTLVGHKTFTVEEDDCAQPRLFTGWTTERGIGRDLDRGMFVGPNPRLHDTTIVDINAAFGFRQITGEDGNRPEETWQARCTWILQSDYLDDAISHSEDFIVANTTMMDAADYRGSAPSAVMDDLSDRSGNAYTYFLFWDPAATAITLFFDNPTSFIAASTLSISNVYADVDNATCFAPDSVAKLAREPDQTYSEVVVEYNDGTQKLFRSRPATEAAYIRRGTTIQRPYTKSVATATSQADKWLTKHSVEVDRITCSIQVPSSAAGLVQAGQSIAVRFTHMSEPYATGTTMRVVSCSPKPTNDVADFYTIDLELVGAPVVVPTGGKTIGFLACRSTADVAAYNAGVQPETETFTGSGIYLGDWVQDTWGLCGTHPPFIGNGGYALVMASSDITADAIEEIFGASSYGLTTFTSPSIAATGAGYIFAGFSYTASGPGDGASAPFVMEPTAPAVTLTRGYTSRTSAPYSWCGYLPVAAAGDYTITLTRSAVPRNAWYPHGWIVAFFAGVTGVVQSGTSTWLGGSCPYTWDTQPGTQQQYVVWGGEGIGFNGTSSPRCHMVEVTVDPYSGGTVGGDLPPPPGVQVTNEQASPPADGTTTAFTISTGYRPGSLRVSVDAIMIPVSEVTEVDPAAGTFTLSWAPDADERITCTYSTG